MKYEKIKHERDIPQIPGVDVESDWEGDDAKRLRLTWDGGELVLTGSGSWSSDVRLLRPARPKMVDAWLVTYQDEETGLSGEKTFKSHSDASGMVEALSDRGFKVDPPQEKKVPEESFPEDQLAF